MGPDPYIHVFLIQDEKGVPMAHFHLTDFIGKTCQFHYSVRKEYRPMALEMAEQAIKVTFTFGLSAILGITPKVNRAAVKALLAAGFVQQAEIPDFCKIGDRFYPAIASMRLNNGQ